MGIKNLNLLLNSKCSCAINQRNLNNYNGMIIGIDLSIFLYKYLYGNNDHIEGLTRLILRLLKNNIIPIFIFDGKPPKEKEDTILERKLKKEFMHMKKEIMELILTKRNESYENIKIYVNNYILNHNKTFNMDDNQILELINKNDNEIQEDIEKIKKKIIHVKSSHIKNAKYLFDLFGISYIESPCEAETLLAYMSKNNYIDGCITEDMDILASGGRIFLKNFSSEKNFIEEYCLEGILENLELNQEEFIDLCILCGCDYTQKVFGMGCINAYKLIKKYNNIENVLKSIENNTKYKVPNDFDFVGARKLFNIKLDEIFIKNNLININMNKPKLNELINFLKTTNLHNKYKKDIQENLMNYYLNIISISKLDNINKIINNTNNNTSNNVNNIPKITDFFDNNV
jgi:flap endonuclease-1